MIPFERQPQKYRSRIVSFVKPRDPTKIQFYVIFIASIGVDRLVRSLKVAPCDWVQQ
jgi:hypothetical protein